MPISSPAKNEDQATYLARGHKALASEFPDTKTRNAVLFESWRRHKGESAEEKAAYQRFMNDPNQKYEMIRDVPVFKEHSYVRRLFNRDGTPQIDPTTGTQAQQIETYDFKALKAMVDNCNRRVRETESFAPIIDMHTGKRKPDGTIEQPAVFGFGGPYRLGMYGNEERDDGMPYKGKWAIYMDEFWFADKAHKAREMPRRSPEVYVGRPIMDRFLDPITALGAETPALDMGIHYTKDPAGNLVERYSSPDIVAYDGAACMPGAANVVVPKPVDEKDKKARYDGDDEMQYALGSPSNMSDEFKSMLADPAKKSAYLSQAKSLFAHHKAKHLEHEAKWNELRASGDEYGAQKHGQASFGHKRRAEQIREDYMDVKNHVTDHGTAPLEVAQPSEKKTIPNLATSKYSQVDSDTVNACVDAMMNTQVMQRIAQFLDAQDAPVNPKTMLQSEEMEQAEQQGLEADGTPAGEPPNPLAAQQEVEEAHQPNEADESDVTVPNPNAKGDEMPDPKVVAPANAPAAPPVVDPKEEKKEQYAMQDFMRDMKVKYDQQETRISTLEERNNGLIAERNAAVREAKIVKLRRSGYSFNEQEAIAKYSQASEEVFQTWADTIVECAPKAEIGGPNLFIPSMDLPEGARAQDVGQYGGAQMEDVEGIVQYQLSKLQAGETLTYAQAKDGYLRSKTA